MTYQDRLKPEITLTSPNGSQFAGKWADNDIQVTKKIAQFKYPKINGTIVQDLGSDSRMHPIIFYFDGPDYDLELLRFDRVARAEFGQWRVIHPVLGLLGVEIMSYTLSVAPVKSGNVGACDVKFIEGIDPVSLKTAAQLASNSRNLADLANATSADQFVKNIITDSLTGLTAITDTVNEIQSAADEIFGPIVQTVTEIDRQFALIQDGIQGTLDAVILRPLQLAAQIQNLIQLPLQAIDSIKNRLAYYKKYAERLFGISPIVTTAEGKNITAVKELGLTSVITANSLIGADKDNLDTLFSRVEVLNTADNLINNFVLIVNSLDEDQDFFKEENLENQYFSQTDSFIDTLNATTNSMNFLIDSSLSLKIEKRIILDRPDIIANVVVNNYGSLGENDSNLDLFIDTNNIQGNDFILLNAGRELLFYV